MSIALELSHCWLVIPKWVRGYLYLNGIFSRCSWNAKTCQDFITFPFWVLWPRAYDQHGMVYDQQKSAKVCGSHGPQLPRLLKVGSWFITCCIILYIIIIIHYYCYTLLLSSLLLSSLLLLSYMIMIIIIHYYSKLHKTVYLWYHIVWYHIWGINIQTCYFSVERTRALILVGSQVMPCRVLRSLANVEEAPCVWGTVVMNFPGINHHFPNKS